MLAADPIINILVDRVTRTIILFAVLSIVVLLYQRVGVTSVEVSAITGVLSLLKNKNGTFYCYESNQL